MVVELHLDLLHTPSLRKSLKVLIPLSSQIFEMELLLYMFALDPVFLRETKLFLDLF